ncbi:unnamed protein product [Rotaria socialis]|uniref:Replication factor-A protein 1 N-terminal domain-containing protein n=1 Tax=Rotaria socialis TaxID=392032 RepID=A0A818FS83_9BILA|nr:unnamed protein product [Rotaria socialis]
MKPVILQLLNECFDALENFCFVSYISGALEEHDDHLGSRLGKSVDTVHRIVGICQTIELASNMFKEYIAKFGYFEDYQVSEEFTSKCKSLFFELYGSSIDDNRRFYITIDVVERAIDVVSGNIEQYKLLMFLPENESINYCSKLNNAPGSGLMMKHMDKKAKKREKFVEWLIHDDAHQGMVQDVESTTTSRAESYDDIPVNEETIIAPDKNCLPESMTSITQKNTHGVQNETHETEVDEPLAAKKHKKIHNQYCSFAMCEVFPNLTIGSRYDYMKGRKGYSAILQVLEIRLIKTKEPDSEPTEKRYRLILYDGKHFMSSCVLGINMSGLVKNDILKNNSIARVNSMDVCNAVTHGERWIIKTCVVNKSNLREYSKVNRNGKVFNLGLVDKSDGIQVAAFDRIAEQFYKKLEIKKNYFLSNASITPANQIFNPFTNIYQMILRFDTQVRLC